MEIWKNENLAEWKFGEKNWKKINLEKWKLGIMEIHKWIFGKIEI